MSEGALVSIVIPCFNQGHYLGDAIQSALAVRHSRVEVIVVNDGSTDHTETVARSYCKVDYVYQSNQDVGAARNTGIRRSTGDFLIFLDSDDRLLPNAIEAGLNCFGNHAGCGLVFGRYRKIDRVGKIISDPTQPQEEPDFYMAMLQRNPIGHPAVAMHRRAVLEQIGDFDTTYKGSCEYHLYLRIARQFPVYKHDEIIAEYRSHEGQTTLKYRYMLENTIRALRTQSDYASGEPRFRRAMSNGLTNWRNHYGMMMVYDLRNYLMTHGLNRESIDRFRTLVSCYPQGVAALLKSAMRSVAHRVAPDRSA